MRSISEIATLRSTRNGSDTQIDQSKALNRRKTIRLIIYQLFTELNFTIFFHQGLNLIKNNLNIALKKAICAVSFS